MTGGHPAWQIDPSCKVLIAGLEGAWCYKRIHGSAERFADEPQKNRYSHVCEAQEYGFVGEGEAREMVGRKAPGAAKVSNVRTNSDPIQRFRAQRRERPQTSGIRTFRGR